MSLMAPTTQEEAVFQYCNYGYDKQQYTSFDDCIRSANKNASTGEGTLNSTPPKYEMGAFPEEGFKAKEAKEPIYYILVTAGVLIAGYFAYKKFIK